MGRRSLSSLNARSADRMANSPAAASSTCRHSPTNKAIGSATPFDARRFHDRERRDERSRLAQCIAGRRTSWRIFRRRILRRSWCWQRGQHSGDGTFAPEWLIEWRRRVSRCTRSCRHDKPQQQPKQPLRRTGQPRPSREMLALDDPPNDAVSANVSTRSGFM